MDVQRAGRVRGARPLTAIALVGLLLAPATESGLAARGKSLAAFDGRCIPGGCVAPPSNTPGILGRRALPARLGAAPDFHHGLLAQAPAAPRTTPAAGSFDRLYEEGQRVNASIRTLTARFTETTTSSLLVRPLVARGTLAVERPARVVMHYVEPEPRVVLIDNNKMTMTWPSRQVMDVGAAMKQVQKYFVDGSAADLRRQFDIDDSQTGEKPGVYRVQMVPRQKRIRDALDKLELWVDQKSSLLESMRMTFANGDTKTMTFENVIPNAVLPPGIFRLDR